MKPPRFIFVHGNDAMHWSFGWAPWLKAELEKLGCETFFETMPDSVVARGKYWLPFLKNYAKAGKNEVIIGWSSGATAAMRYAESNKIKGSILVSPSYTDLDDEMERQSGYFDQPWQWDKIRANQDNIALIWGDDDPYIPQEEFAFIAKQLQPMEIKIPGGKHFGERTVFPELIDYIKKIYLGEAET